jgi:CheY-like chemotaxis protein
MPRPHRPLSSRRPRRAHISADQLASFSHELRTPLNGVLGLARLLEGTQLSAEQRSYTVALRESGQHLLNLVNELLDFARLGGGAVELNPSPVDVEDMLRSVCELLSPRAGEIGLEIGWAAPTRLGRIRGDEGRVKQILLNFAGNAVKFAETGGVLAGVAERPDGRLRFTVEDTGPGVSPEDRQRIFEAFAQASSAHAQLGGAGLGLAIARRLAHAMGGEVGVETSPLGGALFWFEAPFAEHEPASVDAPLAGRVVGIASPNPVVREAARRQIQACGGRAVTAQDAASLIERTRPGDTLLLDHALSDEGTPLQAPADRPAIVLLSGREREMLAPYRTAGFAGFLIKPLRRASLAERVLIAADGGAETATATEDERIAAATAPGVRVLLVEDNPVNALLARALLAREGCEIDHARAGEEALAAVKVGAFDIILMDMRLPGLSGVETARLLRTAGVRSPIVALTANAFDDDRNACLAAGMDDYLVKPLSPEALRALLSRWARAGWTGSATRAKVG